MLNRWRLPLTLAATFAIAVILSAWLLPIAYTRWQIAGLSSDNPARQNTSLRWVIQHASADRRTFDAIIAAIADMPYDAARRTYLAIRQSANYLTADPALGPALQSAYADAPLDAWIDFVATVDRLEGWWFSLTPLFHERLSEVEDDEAFAELVEHAHSMSLWNRRGVGPEPWLRWIESLATSPHPTLRRRAVVELLDTTLEMRSVRYGWAALDRPLEDQVLRMLAGLQEDHEPDIRFAAWLTTQAWEVWLQPDVAQPELLQGRFNRVVPAFAQPPDPSDPYRSLLWQVESSLQNPGTPATWPTPVQALPPLPQTLLARHLTPEQGQAILQPLLAADHAWTRALAAVVAAELPEATRTPLVNDLLNSVDPVARASAYLIDRLQSGFPADAWGWGPWSQDGPQPEKSAIALAVERETDPAARRIATSNLYGSAANDALDPTAWPALLHRDGVPYATMLTAMLATKTRAGWDHLLGPFGLPDDQLLTLLDHYRFAWVLDALMPPEAPRFPLWVDRETQLEAIAALRVWYARNRATWTHG